MKMSKSNLMTAMLLLIGSAIHPIGVHGKNPSGTMLDSIVIKKNVMVRMRDGIKLATDIYRMQNISPAPVLICRTPYNKEYMGVDRLRRFIESGYVVVCQDVRGRYASEGDFNPHFNETKDGVDCFEWAASQSWSNGKIGTFGGSYLGGTQWLPAREDPPMLKAMVPEVTFSDMYEGNTHPGGVKVLHDLRWAAANIVRDAVDRKKNAGESIPDDIQYPDVDEVLRTVPVGAHPLLKKYASFYDEWLRHPQAGEYWDSISPSTGYSNISVPSMNISGWYDIFIQGTLNNYVGMKEHGKTSVARSPKLIIGPWSHMNFTGKFPERDFGETSSDKAIDLDGIKLRWYDRWLRDRENGIDTEDPVMIFVMGADEWRTEKDWPLPDTKYTPFYLDSGGKANTNAGDGTLSMTKPGKDQCDTFVYDPMNPVPTVGGQVILPGENSMGPRDQQEVEMREDVLVYTTQVLDKDVEVTGPVSLKLYISSDSPDTDFAAKLVDVYPDGRAMILTNGILRCRYRNSFTDPELMIPGNIYEIDINMLATSNLFRAGHRIRLEISSSNFPQFARNSNSGGNLADETADKYHKAVNKVYHSDIYPSCLILPIIER